jgi:hypothetical protein
MPAAVLYAAKGTKFQFNLAAINNTCVGPIEWAQCVCRRGSGCREK